MRDVAETFNKPAARRGYVGIHATNVLLLALLWLLTIGLYAQLPDMVPGHMGLRGVTRWEPRGSGTWFLLPIMGTWSAALMYLLSLLVNGGAAAINIPRKKQILALPREAQTAILEPVRPFMFLMATWVLVLMCWLQWTFYRAALGGPGWRQDSASLGVMLVLMLLPFAGVFVLSRQVSVRLDAWSSRGPA
jgi:magnesium-transporting ATPase (P-type)